MMRPVSICGSALVCIAHGYPRPRGTTGGRPGRQTSDEIGVGHDLDHRRAPVGDGTGERVVEVAPVGDADPERAAVLRVGREVGVVEGRLPDVPLARALLLGDLAQ